MDTPIDANALPSQAEMEELARLVTHTGASLQQLMHFRETVLHAAAEKIRAWAAAPLDEGVPGSAADVIDPAWRP